MEEKKPLDRGAIGKRIAQVRKKAGLTQIEFARKLQVPVMITEIAEHGIRSADDVVVPINISIKELVRLLQRISSIFDVPIAWLMYGEGKRLKTSECTIPCREELTLYLPVTICDRSLADEMNEALLLMDMHPSHAEERAVIQRDRLEAIIQKYCLYQQHADCSGSVQCAARARTQMLDAINRYRSPY